jgi:predicted Rossmann fold flavoprotein
MSQLKVAVIGGGASGFFAAIHAASHGASVTIIEKSSKLLAKVKISGGGRCNVTHDAVEISKLVKNYPRGEKFLKKTFQKFSVKDTIQWFESRSIKLKIESDGRMFPVTDDSQSIIDALIKEARNSGVVVRTNFGVTAIQKRESKFEISSKDENLTVDKVIVCVGGFPKIEGFSFLEKLGHTIVSPVPSLFTFNTPKEPLREFMGISVPDAVVKLEGSKLAYRGPLLITHWGVSGPAVLKLSAFGALWLNDKQYRSRAIIRWDADQTEETVNQKLLDVKQSSPKKMVSNTPLFKMPSRLWNFILKKSEITETTLWLELSKKQMQKLVQNIFCYVIEIEGKTTYKDEFVTAGGVSLDEINPETMESKKVFGLYFAGEVVNIDGITGGFNFQAAWSTGYIAGINASKKVSL